MKRQRSAMNEEDTAPVQQPSTIAENSTTHKRQRHTSPKAPVEPNKLARLEQSDATLKVGFVDAYTGQYLIEWTLLCRMRMLQ